MFGVGAGTDGWWKICDDFYYRVFDSATVMADIEKKAFAADETEE
jgi:hypothetical protein